MSDKKKIDKEYLPSIHIEDVDLQDAANILPSNTNQNNHDEPLFQHCDRGHGARAYLSHIARQNIVPQLPLKSQHHFARVVNVSIDLLTTLSFKSTEPISESNDTTTKSDENLQELKPSVAVQNSPSSLKVNNECEKQQYLSQPVQINNEYENQEYSPPSVQINIEYKNQQSSPSGLYVNNEYGKNDCSLNISNENQLQKILKVHQHLSRFQIEEEISNMIHNVLSFNQRKKCELLKVADSHCHLDILFDKLNCPNQSIKSYVAHNHRIYEQGIDMLYVVQCYFAPEHFDQNKWQEKYSKYLKYEIVYGKLGLHPLFSHHYNLTMELQIRRCLSNGKILAIGEVGLDYQTASRPSNDLQIRAFIEQLRLARSNKLPVVIYSRESFVPVLEILCQELPYDYPICWRNFAYGLEELNMLYSRFNCVFLGCSPQVFINKKMKKIIESVNIDFIIPESVAPHLTIEDCPHVWETHPIFVASVYKFIARIFGISIEDATNQLVENFKKFYKLS